MKKNIMIFLLLIIVIVLGIFATKEIFNDNKKHVEKPIVDTFLYDFRDGYDYSSGAAQLYGYVEVEDRSDTESNSIYQYVTFHILESNSEEFMKYLKSNKDDLYIKEDAIGLGCIINNSIKLVNYSDNNEFKDSTNVIDYNVDALLSSTKDNPVLLNIGKYINTMYNDYHPVCESPLSFFYTP